MTEPVATEAMGAGAPDGGGHGSRPPVDDHKVPWRVFAVIGLVLGVIGAVYRASAYENAGTVMLLVSAILAFWVGGYLWLRQRAPGEPATAAPTTATLPPATPVAAPGAPTAPAPATEVVEHYLPHASLWPFVTGLGGAGIGVGIVVGWWVVVPGVALLALGLGGFVRQTRRRD